MNNFPRLSYDIPFKMRLAAFSILNVNLIILRPSASCQARFWRAIGGM